MPLAAHVSIVKIRKWFPPSDPLAASHSAPFRRIYFLRNLVKTQLELSGAIQVLLKNPEFKRLLSEATLKVRAGFKKAANAIGKAHPIAKGCEKRHLRTRPRRGRTESVETIHPGAWGFLDVSRTAKHTHYKFAGELIAAILLKGVSDEDKAKIQSGKWETIAQLVPLFALIEHCFVIYGEDRRLF